MALKVYSPDQSIPVCGIVLVTVLTEAPVLNYWKQIFEKHFKKLYYPPNAQEFQKLL